MTKTKHDRCDPYVPTRQCVSCRSIRPLKELKRIVRHPDGSVGIDTDKKTPGRGAYLCNDNPACLQMAKKWHALERALGTEIPEDIWDRLNKEQNDGKTG